MVLGENKPTVALDFDGVIHAYSKGWHDGTAYDPPFPGAIEAIKALMGRYTVYVFSTREPEQIQDWFGQHGEQIVTELIPADQQFWTKQGVLGIAKHKVVAYVWLDDRALRFNGSWATALEDIDNLVAGRMLKYDGETSDGYHTFNELYQHRIVLFVALAEMVLIANRKEAKDRPEVVTWCSQKHSDGSKWDGWFIAGLELSTGQVTYHLPMSDWERVSKILPVVEQAPEWDGHTPADVVDRLERWVYGGKRDAKRS